MKLFSQQILRQQMQQMNQMKKPMHNQMQPTFQQQQAFLQQQLLIQKLAMQNLAKVCYRGYTSRYQYVLHVVSASEPESHGRSAASSETTGKCLARDRYPIKAHCRILCSLLSHCYSSTLHVGTKLHQLRTKCTNSQNFS